MGSTPSNNRQYGMGGAELSKPPFELFDAFIAYSHNDQDRRALSLLSCGLSATDPPVHPFHVPSAASTPDPDDVWPTIYRCMAQSRYLLLLASPDSAGSSSIGQELRQWVTTKPKGRLIVVVTRGDYVWDPTTSDFDFDKSPAIHPALRGAFGEEPLLFDMRWAKFDVDGWLNCVPYFDLLIDIASVVHGQEKNLIGVTWPLSPRRYHLPGT